MGEGGESRGVGFLQGDDVTKVFGDMSCGMTCFMRCFEHNMLMHVPFIQV